MLYDLDILPQSLWLKVWLFYTIICATSAMYAFMKMKKLNKAWDLLSAEEKEKFAPVERLDSGQHSFFAFLLGAIFLLPIRLILTIWLLAMHDLLYRILMAIHGVDDKTPTKELKGVRPSLVTTSRIFCSSLLYVCGIVRINQHFANAALEKQFKKSPPKNIISNHVSCLDIIYFIVAAYAGFVSKASVRNAPLVGVPARMLKTIFVDRDSVANRAKTLDNLVQRYKENIMDENANPLVVFPEGTTSNGRCLISFKRGAFSALVPVNPCVLVYSIGSFYLAYELLPSIHFLFLCLSAWPAVNLDAYWLEEIHPAPLDQFSSADDCVNEFMNRARNTMWKTLKLHHFKPANFPGDSCPTSWNSSTSQRAQCLRILKEKASEL